MTPALIFAPGFDTPGRKDATGAFHPESRAYQACRGGKLVHVDNRRDAPTRAEVVIDHLARGSGDGWWRTIAFFCHGTSRDIQLGFNHRNLRYLAEAIARTSERDVRVLLYCCSTASTLHALVGKAVGGDGGFADELRDALCREGATHCRVMGHDTVGHSGRNPHVRFFDGNGSPVGGAGGTRVVRPGTKLWPIWREQLFTDLRFHMPHMEIGQIHEGLVAGFPPRDAVDA